MMFKIVAALLIGLISIVSIKEYMNKSTVDIVRQVKPATVLIANRIDDAKGGIGTGFIVGDNLIVTNNHVIDGNGELFVYSSNSSVKYKAQVINKDKTADLATIKLLDWNKFSKNEHPNVVALSDEETELGDKIIVIGHPWGLTWTVSEGIISGKNRKQSQTPQFFDQVDANLFQGNSGGPVFDEEGNVVCVSAVMLTGEGGSYGFCLPSELVQKVLADFSEYNEVRWRSLNAGIEITENSEIKISEVKPDKSADKAGLKVGDTINKIYNNEHKKGLLIKSSTDLLTALASMRGSEEKITLEIIRNGKPIKIEVITDYKTSKDFN